MKPLALLFILITASISYQVHAEGINPSAIDCSESSQPELCQSYINIATTVDKEAYGFTSNLCYGFYNKQKISSFGSVFKYLSDHLPLLKNPLMLSTDKQNLANDLPMQNSIKAWEKIFLEGLNITSFEKHTYQSFKNVSFGDLEFYFGGSALYNILILTSGYEKALADCLPQDNPEEFKRLKALFRGTLRFVDGLGSVVIPWTAAGPLMAAPARYSIGLIKGSLRSFVTRWTSSPQAYAKAIKNLKIAGYSSAFAGVGVYLYKKKQFNQEQAETANSFQINAEDESLFLNQLNQVTSSPYESLLHDKIINKLMRNFTHWLPLNSRALGEKGLTAEEELQLESYYNDFTHSADQFTLNKDYYSKIFNDLKLLNEKQNLNSVNEMVLNVLELSFKITEARKSELSN